MTDESIADVFGVQATVTPPTAKPAVAGKKVAAPVQDIEDVFGRAKKSPSMLQEIIPAVDTVLGFPAFIAQMGMTGVADIAALVDGSEHPLAAGSAIINKAMQTPWMKFMQKPIQTAMQTDTSDTKMEEVGNWITKQVDAAADYAVKKTGNPEAGEAVRQGANIAMAKGGDAVRHIVMKGADAMRTKPSGSAHTDTPAPETPAEEKAPEPTHGTLFGKDAQINADKIAHDMIKRGAPLRDVLAARKRNPLVGDAIDRIMGNRQMFRSGPMAEGVSQGEAAPPEFQSGRERVSQALPDPHEYGQVVREHADVRVRQLELKDAEAVKAREDGKAAIPDELKAVEQKYPNKQQGGYTDVKTLVKIAAAGVGAAAGYALADKEDKIEGTLRGALGGLILTAINPMKAIDVAKKLTAHDDRITIGDLGDNQEVAIKSAEIVHHIMKKKIDERVPDKKRQAAITHWVEGDLTQQLAPHELAVAKEAKAFFEKLAQEQNAAGTLKGYRENYVTHIWEWGLQGKSALERAFANKAAGAGMSPKSQFSKERTISTIAEGKKLGLTPKTEAIGEIMEVYGNSAARAMANKRLIDGLRAAKTLDGTKLSLPADKAPHTYVSINHPQLNGLKVHPDIAPSLQFLFDTRTPSAAGRALDAFNTALKRTAVSFSLFHNKALTDAFIGGSSKPWKALSNIAGFVTAKDAYLRQLNDEGLTPLIQSALKGGLTFTLDKATSVDEDVGGAFYGALKDLQGMADQIVPGMGKPIEGIAKINHAVDTLTWARMHTGMKLNIFAEKLEQIKLNNARAHEANPEKVPLFKEGEAEKIAASFTNDIFGGLNWRRIAEATKREWARDIALGALKPSSRRMMQLLMFAPDWTLSTVRAMTQAAGKGSSVKGLLNARTLADLHRQYMIRSAIYYMTVGDGINYAMSGHHIWDDKQKDKTRIDLGDGRTMQWSKHTMDSIHWVLNPSQQMLNKFGAIPKQMIEQALHKEYLSAHGQSPEMKGSRLGHLLKGISPIAVQQNFDAGSSAGIAGFLGAPIYGKTREQKFDDKMKKEMSAMTPEQIEERRKKRMQQLEEQ